MFRIIFISLLTLFLAACQGFLEDIEPQDSLLTADGFQNLSDLENGLTGAYAAMMTRDRQGTHLFATELMTSNVTRPASAGFPAYGEFLSQQIQTTNFLVGNCWTESYAAINQLNLILESLDALEFSAADQAQVERIRGEALFLRASLYFDLLRLYGLVYDEENRDRPQSGVPLLTTGIISSEGFTLPERATLEAVYEQAFTDLEEAAGLLPATAPSGRPGALAARALQARMAFQRDEYGEALDYLEPVLSSGLFSLTNEPRDFFTNEGNAEEVWVGNVATGQTSWLTQIAHPNVRREAVINSDLINSGFEDIITANQQQILSDSGWMVTDLRRSQLLVEDDVLTYTDKYEDAVLQTDDAPFLRYAEVLLMQAECLARTEGVKEKALAPLNMVRQRALRIAAEGNPLPAAVEALLYGPEDFSSPEELIEAIVLERRVELNFEGNYLHDQIRLQRSSIGQNGLSYDDPRLRWPIPQREIDANPNLVQNEGY